MKPSQVPLKSNKSTPILAGFVHNSDAEDSNQSDNADMSNTGEVAAPQHRRTTLDPDAVELDRQLMDSVKRMSMGDYDLHDINTIYDVVCQKNGFDFSIHLNKAKEDGLRRQWGISMNDDNEVQRLPSSIEYLPVMTALSRWWDSSATKVSELFPKNSPDKLLKVYSVDYMKK